MARKRSAHNAENLTLVGLYGTVRGYRLVFLCPSGSVARASYVFHVDQDGGRAYCTCEAYHVRGRCALTRSSRDIVRRIALSDWAF